MRKLQIFLSVIGGLILITMVTGLAITFWPYKPVRIDGVFVDKKEVSRGEEICFRFVGEKFMAVPVDVIIELINEESIPIVKYSSNLPPGTNFKTRCFIIPPTAKLHSYRIRWTGTYKINALNYKTYTALSPWFAVTDNSADIWERKKAKMEREEFKREIGEIKREAGSARREKAFVDRGLVIEKRDKVYMERDKTFEKRDKVYRDDHK